MAILAQLLSGSTRHRTRLTLKDPLRVQNGNVSQEVGILEFDALISIADEHEAEVTQHPVEQGADISDHIKVKNIRLKLEGVVSETPLDLDASKRGLITSAGSNLGSLIGGSLGGGLGAAAAGLGAQYLIASVDKAQAARLILVSILQAKRLFKISTPKFELENVVMTSISFPRDQSTGKALRFSLQIQQMQLVKSEEVRLDNVNGDVLHTAPKSGDLGKQNSGLLDDQANEKGASILSSLTGLK